MTIKQTGYSLWEMLIVLMCMIMVTSMMAISYIDLSDRVHADRTILQLYRAIILARGTAIHYNAVVTICPVDRLTQLCGLDWSQSLIVFRDDQRDGMIHDAQQVIRRISLSNTRGTIQWRNFRQKKYLQFLPYGFTYALNGTFLYCSFNSKPKYARAIFVSKNGAARFSLDSDKDGIHEDGSGKILSCTADLK